jgi:unsaturated rhamnogalacturonyl hydrolase
MPAASFARLSPSAAELIHRLASRTMEYPYRVWGYGEGIGLEGLLRASEITGERSYGAFVHGLVQGWAVGRPDVRFADHVAPGRVLLEVYERTGDARLLEQAYRLAELFDGFPRTPLGTALHRPDHETFRSYAYVDCIHVDAPFLCRIARISGDDRFRDLGVELLLGHIRVLWDESAGLFHHLYDHSSDRTNGAFWGRGNGWAILGLIDTLEELPDGDPRRPLLERHLRRQAESLAGLQDASGHWRTVLDEPGSYLESSLAAFFCTAFTRAVQVGLLGDSYLDVAERAWIALSSRVDGRGTVLQVSEGTPPGNAEHYARVPTGGPYPWGQGPALLAASARAAASAPGALLARV